MGVLPAPWKVTPHGAFGYVRNDPSEGSAGHGTYPSTHYGVDLAGEPGDEVLAPEDGELVAVMANLPGKDVRPWRGYGPGLVVIKGASGRWHLLAHLDQADLRKRFPLWSSGEVDPAKNIRDQVGNTNVMSARGGSTEVPTVTAGTVVGIIGDAKHVHWEVRKTKLGQGYNPATWADTFVWHQDTSLRPSDANVDAVVEPETSFLFFALVVAALVFKPRGWPR